MKVTVLTGPQGGGKSTIMREEAIAQPGLYLFASPTHELIEEQTAAFRAEAPRLKIWPVHSKTKGTGLVEARLEHACSKIMGEGHKHAIILTTHDAMMDSDLPAQHLDHIATLTTGDGTHWRIRPKDRYYEPLGRLVGHARGRRPVARGIIHVCVIEIAERDAVRDFRLDEGGRRCDRGRFSERFKHDWINGQAHP